MVGRGRGWIVVLPLVAVFAAACAEVVVEEMTHEEPAIVEPIEGTDLAWITLTERAAERIDLQTTPVEAAGSGTVVPSAALIVDPNGGLWVYTNPDHLVFIRQEIRLDREDGGRAFLLDGPPVGMEVVTIGAAELYGAEYGIGK